MNEPYFFYFTLVTFCLKFLILYLTLEIRCLSPGFLLLIIKGCNHSFIGFSKLFLLRLYHWNLCSIILAVSQWPDRDFFKCLEWKTKQQKKHTKNHFLWFLQIGSELEQYFNAKSIWLKCCLSLYLWLHESQRSAKGVSLESSQVFSEHASVLGHTFYLPDFPIALPSLFSHVFSSSVSSFPGF